MPQYICSFCNYQTIYKNHHYSHLYNHITLDNFNTFSEDEIKLCYFYYSKKVEYKKKYYENNKEKLLEKSKIYRLNNIERMLKHKREYQVKYRQNNKEKISHYDKEIRERRS